MFNYQLTLASPWYLLLLAVLPVLWWHSLSALAPLGPLRRLVVLALRSLVVVLLVLALAEIQMVRSSDRLTVIFLLDQSLSIPPQQRRAMIDYVNAEIQAHRRGRDRVGAIVFGREAAIEVPPFDDNVRMTPQIESPLDPQYTNLAAAMKLAQASFPEDAAKRIVVLSDGNENLGRAAEQVPALAAAGVGIDVVPIRYRSRAEVAVERLAIPPDVRRGEPFDLKVVVHNTTQPTARDNGAVRGTLTVSQLTEGQPLVLSQQEVTLPPGKRVFAVRQKIEAANFYTYEARFVPDRPEDDTFPQNNRATAFTQVQGMGQVLLIEDFENPGEFSVLVERLRRQGLEVTVRPSHQLFSSLAELQQFDTVLLANVPREHFSEEQIQMLVSNTQQMGAGVVMLGGPNSFGAGGWANSELEKAMPVDFQIQSAKVVPRGALVLLMHASEIPAGNYWQKVIAQKAIEVLGPQDYCGLIHWSGTEQWLWGRGLLPVGENRRQMMARVDRMTPGDMPDFDPGLRMAQQGFAQVPDAAVRHMIIISDGDPGPPSPAVMQALTAMNPKLTISTVAVGAHGPPESQRLAGIAAATGGKYYSPQSAKALPRIFQVEARRVARPLIWDSFPVEPRVKFPHEMQSGLGDPLPPIKGFVLTSKKENPLVETVLVSPQPAGEENNTILAAWTYGLGKAVAFTSDAGARWTTDWTRDALYDRLFGQMVRWSMRPVGGTGKFTTATELDNGRVRVVVTALDKNDELLNFLNLAAVAVGPDLKPVPLAMQQVAPGRYVGTFPVKDSGSYLVNVTAIRPKDKRDQQAAGKDHGGVEVTSLRTGVNVPYSDEFRDRSANEALLGQLAGSVPKGGSPGRLIGAAKDSGRLDSLPAVNTFRHDLAKATSSQDIWHYMLLLGSCLFFFDVFFRRVQVGLGWVPPLAGKARDWLLRRQPQAPKPQYMERLRSRKAEVSGRLDQMRASARFEPAPQQPADLAVLEEPAKPAVEPKPAPPPTAAGPPAEEEESYTERLLRAKKKVWEDRGEKS
jgi:Mg-chelatase subunit ChlD/uncharacterized membrane protein